VATNRPLPPRTAVTLLNQARRGLEQVEYTNAPNERFVGAHLAALRAAAAVLAVRGRPHRARSRPTSVWVLLAKMAPELREWAAFFASGSDTRAAVQAGLPRCVSTREADDLVRQVGQFLGIIEHVVRGGTR
jgi:hypothetical protein